MQQEAKDKVEDSMQSLETLGREILLKETLAHWLQCGRQISKFIWGVVLYKSSVYVIG